MDEEQNVVNTTAPIVVDETETVKFDEKEESTKLEDEEAQSDTCCEKILKCLSHVPCASLIAWIILLLGLGGITGSLMIGAQKTRSLLKSDEQLWFVEFMLAGVIASMFVLGTIFLSLGHLSSDPTSRRIFNSTSKNRCARGMNIFLLIFVYILTILWILASAILTVPLVMLVLLFIVTDFNNLKCIDLENYGFAKREICGNELNVFTTDAKDVLVCYAVAYFSAVFIAVSLIHFLISISANITHLKDNRFATLNAYETEEHHNSKHSVLDTNM